jgi:hypothetical protein
MKVTGPFWQSFEQRDQPALGATANPGNAGRAHTIIFISGLKIWI